MDLSTTYCGFELKNPLVAAASPMSREVSGVRALEDAGVAAVVVYSLFEEQIEHEMAAAAHFEKLGTESFAESLSYMPQVEEYTKGPDDYLEHIAALKKAVSVPIIASLNGRTVGGWVEYAKKMEQAGADGLEMNIYRLAANPNMTGEQIEGEYLDILREVKNSVRIPVAMKLSPFFTSFANFAKKLDDQGADGLVLFNRFYQPDVDLDALEVTPGITWSATHEMRLPLRWIAILDPVVKASIAASTGVYKYEDVLKLMMAGADVAMLCAAVLREGPAVVGKILEGLETWMTEHEYQSIRQMQGSMNHRSVEDPGALERANYMKALIEYK